MSANISGDHRRMREVGTQLADKQYVEFNQIVEKIYNEIESLQQKWKGIDQASFINNIMSKRPAINGLGDSIQGYGNFLLASSNYLRKAQEEISSAAANV